MEWLAPCHWSGNGPPSESPTKPALVQNRDAYTSAQKNFLGQESNRESSELRWQHRLRSRGPGPGQPWPLLASRAGELWPLLSGPESPSDTEVRLDL